MKLEEILNYGLPLEIRTQSRIQCGLQRLTFGQFLETDSFHLWFTCGSRGGVLFRGDPVFPKTFSLFPASSEFEQNLGSGGHHSGDLLYLHRRPERGGRQVHHHGPFFSARLASGSGGRPVRCAFGGEISRLAQNRQKIGVLKSQPDRTYLYTDPASLPNRRCCFNACSA